MDLRMTRAAGLALGLSAFVATTASAALTTAEEKRLNSAASVVTALRGATNGISEDLWQKAQCVIVIPEMKKAAFIIGGEFGKGVMSCRTANGWSSPIFMELEKGSWGFQAGATEIDLVLLVMNRDAATKMLDSKVSLGTDASIAAGPVGRAASASTSGNLTAEVLSYSRSRGVFAGIDLSGGALKVDKDANREAYGATTPAEVMAGHATMPPAASAFINTLGSGARATSGKTTPSTTDTPTTPKKKY